MPQVAVLPEGSLINNRYRVISHIGGGAMARVYKVEHVELGTFHALKEQIGEGESEGADQYIEIALKEARFLSKLSHPGIPKVTDFFREGGNDGQANKVYFVMDFVDGQNLKSIMDRNSGRPMDLPTVLRWGIQICDVLIYLHSQNPPIIFRDIKPANLVRRPDGSVSLVDFGIARRVRQGAASDTIVFGSPGYAPPEQYGQGQTGPHSDIYALGATLHHLLSGRDPSSAPFKWPPLRTLNPQVPVNLEKFIAKCLEMEPSRRPENVEAVRTVLRNTLQAVEQGTISPETGLSTGVPTGGVSADQTQLAAQAVANGNGEPVAPAVLPRTGPNFVPAPVTPHTHPEHGEGYADSVYPRTLSPLHQFMYTLLFVCAMPILAGGVCFPIARNLIAPQIQSAQPAAPQSDEERPDYNAQMARYNSQPDVITRNKYDRLGLLHYLLDIGVLAAFFFGIVRPLKPTRMGMVMAIGGVVGLIVLTGALFFWKPPIFITLAVAEALMFIPIFTLLTTELPEG